jgi:hypothetical protein
VVSGGLAPDEIQRNRNPTSRTMNTYYLIMERPCGSHTWTFAALATNKERANCKAIEIAASHATCTRVVTAQLPKEPDTWPHALFADNETAYYLTQS